MYHVIGHPRTRTFRLMWLLEELDQPYDVLPYPPRSAEMKTVNPSGKTPALRDGDLTVIDSVAASAYLSDKHEQLTYPAASRERAEMVSLLCLICDEIEGSLWTYAKHGFALPEALRVPEVRPSAQKEYARGLTHLAARFGGGPYLTGERFTYADVILGHCAGWAEASKFDPPEDAALQGLFERLLARPARTKALERREQIIAELDAQKERDS